MTSQRQSVDALLFDLGGVLVDLDWDAVFAHWARCCGADPRALRGRFSCDEAYERHERGEIDAAAYFASLRRSLGIAIPDADFHAGWRRVFAGEILPTAALVAQVAARIPLYLFSNTNPAHYDAWSREYAQMLRSFRRVFVSSDLGVRKPAPKAFERVAQEIGVAPARILFFDDTEANVAGARAAGLQAIHVRSPEDVASALAPWLPRR